MSDTERCTLCAAAWSGGDAGKQLKDHTRSFHPAGAAVERAIVTGADQRAVGRDFGPAIGDLAARGSDQQAQIDDLLQRVKALEEGTRSSTDLDVLAEQVTPRLALGLSPAPTPALDMTSASASAEPAYAALQARAKELDIPAGGKREDLEAAIAAREAQLALEAALGNQGGDRQPAVDPAASATGEAGTPPA